MLFKLFYYKKRDMAKQRYGINDGYRGTVGTVIGYMWRGKWCLRSRPRSVRNPNTPRQRAARDLFAQASHLASLMKAAVRLGFNAVALERHRTAHNHFQSVNRDCFALREGRLVVDYENLALAEGPVAPVAFVEPLSQNDGGLCLTVPFEMYPEQRAASDTDEVYLYAWCPSRGEGLLSNPAYRRSRQVTLTLPADWADCEVHLYGFVRDADGRASVSTYLGRGSFQAEGTEETPQTATSPRSTPSSFFVGGKAFASTFLTAMVAFWLLYCQLRQCSLGCLQSSWGATG